MIAREKPAVVFAPHVETSTGILLPDDYIKRATAAVHAQGGLFVLDCIASGTVWANMARCPTRGGPSHPPAPPHTPIVPRGRRSWAWTRSSQRRKRGGRAPRAQGWSC